MHCPYRQKQVLRWTGFLVLVLTGVAQAQNEPDAPPQVPAAPPALRVYEGRVIAQTMH